MENIVMWIGIILIIGIATFIMFFKYHKILHTFYNGFCETE